ncbi:MAG: exopolysaccharide biosynthesis polyprenyl glycosylphosphotransferase [Candidatus Buchananbacteria bacterium]|nr:exopolysaccharide biosynthesis polyprenyl glycosylphosphotransferase [Candidatus Buchananbacteria bacterium]
MKKIDLIFATILIPLDFLMLILAALTAYYLRGESFVTEIKPLIYDLSVSQYLSWAFLVALIWLIIFALAGLYAIKTDRKFIEEFSKIFLACSTGVLTIIVAIFLQRELFSSRFIILTAWIFSIIYVTIGRIIIYKTQKALLKLGLGAKRIIIIGTDRNTNTIIKTLNQKPELGYKVIKSFSNFNLEIKEQILNLHKKEHIDEIIQADPNLPKDKTLDLIDFTEANNISFRFSADIFKTKTSRLEIDTLAGIPIFEIKKTKLEGWGRVYKRIFDIVGSLILIILTSPITLATAIAIKLDSKGPVFFSKLDNGQPVKRVGQYGKTFNYFKFRSMIHQSDSLRYSQALKEKNLRKDSPLFKVKDDPRITKVGKFIRKYSIDELPELFLVLMGKMSLVGPRPHYPEEVANYKDLHKRVLDIKPGITGMAQISGRSDLSFNEEIKLDTYYIENWSLWLDIQILLKTPKVVLFPKREAL